MCGAFRSRRDFTRQLAILSLAWLIDCCLCFGEPIRMASDAPKPLAPAQSAAKIRLPEGFRIDLIASEPVVQEPSCVAFDERGRLFVCELHGYNVEGEIDVAKLNETGTLDRHVGRIRWELQGGPIATEARKRQYGVVKLLRDSDGDGVMDTAVVWADDLPPCYGLLAVNGGILVTCAPEIVFLADTDNDGRVDVRETLFHGFKTEVLERGINNPRWGIDNWVYIGSGGSGGKITGPHLAKSVELGSTDFRIKPDGSAIEPVTGSVGTFGMTINDVGDRFPASGGEPATFALPIPHRYLVRNPYVPSPRTTYSAADHRRGFRISEPHPWRVRRRQDPNWVKFYGERETNSHYFSGGCSNEFYGDALFPEEYRGNLFYCEPSLNIIHRCVLERDGAGYRGRRAQTELESEFLASSDQWFRPMNLRVGPDGALYIVDMYREIIEDYSAIPRFLQQQYGLDKGRDRGRIWRLAPTDAKLPAVPDLVEYSADQLIAAVRNRDSRWLRTTARRLLVGRKGTENSGKLAEALTNALRDATGTPQAKINVLYTLAGLGALRLNEHLAPLSDAEDYRVRIHVIRLAECCPGASATSLVARMGGDSDPSVRIQAVLSLGVLMSAERNAASARRRQSRSLFEIAREFGNEPWMQAAILSSASNCASELIERILISDGGFNGNTKPLLRPLAATAVGQPGEAAVSQVLSILVDAPAQAQIDCLTGLVEGRRSSSVDRSFTAQGKASLVNLLKNSSHEVRKLAIQVAREWSPANEAANVDESRETNSIQSLLQELFDEAATVAIDSTAIPMDRQRAVAILSVAPLKHALILAELIRPTESLEIQISAVNALGNSAHPQVGKLLIANWITYTPTVRKAVMSAIFARDDRLPALLDEIDAGVVLRSELSASQRERLANLRDASVASRAKQWFAKPTSDKLFQQQVVRYRAALLADRDVENGKQSFAKNCLSCHKHGKQGHDVGPHLGTIGNKPDETVLLDILRPSDRIEPDFRTYSVATVDGRNLTGVLKSESPTNVILLKEKGEAVSILRREIESMRVSNVSMMPANFHEQIPPKELADLIGYMRAVFTAP